MLVLGRTTSKLVMEKWMIIVGFKQIIRSIIPNANSCRHRLPDKSSLRAKTCTACEMSKYGVISSPNTEKWGLEITPYLDIFHAVMCSITHVCTNDYVICHSS